MAVNQLKAGAVLTYVLLGLNTLVGLLYTPYMLRMIGQSEFGIYSLGISILNYLSVLDFGFGNAAVRYTAKFRSEGKTDMQYSMFGMFIILYSIMGIVAFLIGLGLYFNIDSIFGNTMTFEEIAKVRVLIFLMIFNIAFTFPLSIFGAIITAYENFIFQKVLQIVRAILNTVVMIVLLKLGYRAIGMVVVVTLFNLVTLLANAWYCKNKIKIKINFRKFQWSFIKEIGTYSFYIFLYLIVDRIYWSTGQFVLGATIGTIAVAVFAVALQLVFMYGGFSIAISGVFLPKVTAMTTKEQSSETISDLFIRTGRVQYIIMAFILTGFILFGKQFIIFWAGADYADAYIITLLFFISLIVPSIQNLGITILQARNQMKFLTFINILMALFSLVLQIALVKKYGGVGCAIGISIALIPQAIVMNIYYHKKQGINILKFFKEIIMMSLTPIILGIVTYFLIKYFPLNTGPKLGLGIVIFSLIYIPVFWLISMNQYERDLLGKPILSIILRVLRR